MVNFDGLRKRIAKTTKLRKNSGKNMQKKLQIQFFYPCQTNSNTQSTKNPCLEGIQVHRRSTLTIESGSEVAAS